MYDKEFPKSESGVNLLLQTLGLKLSGFAGVLNLDPGDVTFVTDQALNYSYLLTNATIIDDSKEAYTQYKFAIFKGDPNAPVPAAPTFPVISPPKTPVAGIEPRLKGVIKRIKASAGYTQTIGEELGLVDSGPDPISPGSLTAELKVRALPMGRVEIAFSKQGQDAMRVEFKRKADTDWHLVDTFPTSPGIHDAPSVPPGDPESRSYRGVLIRKNQPVGNPSPIYTVVTTP